MSTNRWLATGNYFTSYQDEQRIFFTHLDRSIFSLDVPAGFSVERVLLNRGNTAQ